MEEEERERKEDRALQNRSNKFMGSVKVQFIKMNQKRLSIDFFYGVSIVLF
jgi:hypothetical protein